MRITLLAIFLVFSSAFANADMMLNKAIVVFEAGGPSRDDIIVTNKGDEHLYVNTSILEVKNPGKDNFEQIPVTDPKKAKFLVTPSKIIVPPGGKKQVRLVNIGGHDLIERNFRINFVPALPPDQMDIEGTGVKVLVGYQVFVFIEPSELHEELLVEREGTKLKMTNKGNANVLVQNGTQCPSPDAPQEECKDFLGNRVYPGAEVIIELPFDQPVEVMLKSGNKYQQKRFE